MGNIEGKFIGSSLGRGGMSVNEGVNVHVWLSVRSLSLG